MVRQKKHDDILELLREEGAEAARKAHRGLIIQPGAVGDCILTLPVAEFMKEMLDLGGVDMLGHAEYIAFLPGRSCVDRIISIDSLDMHRLFADSKGFDVADRDGGCDAHQAGRGGYFRFDPDYGHLREDRDGDPRFRPDDGVGSWPDRWSSW